MTENVPSTLGEIQPCCELVQGERRGYVKRDQIEALAIKKFRRTGKGITSAEVARAGLAKNNADARTKIKYWTGKEILFTLGRRCPQVYFPSSIKAEVIEKIKENALSRPTGSGIVGGPLEEIFQEQKARNWLQVLVAAGDVPLQMHGIHLYAWVKDVSVYSDTVGYLLNVIPKAYRGNIGRAIVTFTLSKRGKITIEIACSRTPFNMQTELDISIFFSFLGQVYDRLLFWLDDPRERIAPAVHTWILRTCDLNWDIPINNAEQLTLPDMQVWRAEKVFRTYVKLLSQGAVYRLDTTVRAEEAITPFLEGIVTGGQQLQAGLDDLKAQVAELKKMLKLQPR